MLEEKTQISVEELVDLSAADPVFFAHEFFPRTCRKPSGSVQRRVWDALDAQQRLVNIQVFRGGAKTSILRLFAARRISFLLSRTILYVGKSEEAAIASLSWVKNRILFDTRWTETFGLQKGAVFQDSKLEIKHRALDGSIWLLGAGIEGSIRGINFDDYRPDLIILDDVITESNSATPLARKQVTDLIHGAIKNSLAAPGDAPHAKLVLLSTPQHKEDAAHLAEKDEEWLTVNIPCWSKETQDLPIDQRVSAWEELFPSEFLREQKKFAMARGMGYVFSREMELKIVSEEGKPLREDWLQKLDIMPSRALLQEVILSIDPVPPPSQTQIDKGLHNKDWEVMQIWGRKQGGFYLLDWRRNKGHDPSWTVANFFELAMKWRPSQFVYDAIGAQKYIKWILAEAMKLRAFYVAAFDDTDQRAKFNKIVDTYNGPGYANQIFVPSSYVEFISQWNDYPAVAFDDDLDCGQMAIKRLSKGVIPGGDTEELIEDDEEQWGPAPQRIHLVGC